MAVYPANSGELERTRTNSARIRHRFANTDTLPNSGERSPEYAELSPGEPGRTPPNSGEPSAYSGERSPEFGGVSVLANRWRIRVEFAPEFAANDSSPGILPKTACQ